MPTVLELLGVPPPAHLDGQQLLASAPDPDRAIYIETMAPRLDNGWSSLHGLRRLHDKYILAPRPEYFDLRSDPHELNNLAADEPAEMSELDARLAQVMSRWESPDKVAAQARGLSAEEAERLASLGYVSGPAAGVQGGTADPKDMLPLWKRVMGAEIKSLQGKHAEAVAEIERVVQQDPTDGHAWYYASYIYKRAGRMDDAEKALRRALALSPTAAGYINLAQYLLIRRSLGEDFERALARARQLEPENGGIYIARGDWFVLRGQRDKALAAFERALRIDPVNSGKSAREKIEWVREHL
jgi:tetratricopeptide (TPR) repeat protein